jgi:hypothetical protein
VLLEVYASSIQFITVVIPPHNRELVITLSHSVNVGVAALIDEARAPFRCGSLRAQISLSRWSSRSRIVPGGGVPQANVSPSARNRLAAKPRQPS